MTLAARIASSRPSNLVNASAVPSVVSRSAINAPLNPFLPMSSAAVLTPSFLNALLIASLRLVRVDAIADICVIASDVEPETPASPAIVPNNSSCVTFRPANAGAALPTAAVSSGSVVLPS